VDIVLTVEFDWARAPSAEAKSFRASGRPQDKEPSQRPGARRGSPSNPARPGKPSQIPPRLDSLISMPVCHSLRIPYPLRPSRRFTWCEPRRVPAREVDSPVPLEAQSISAGARITLRQSRRRAGKSSTGRQTFDPAHAAASYSWISAKLRPRAVAVRSSGGGP
jgi:hypothetical protein